MDQTHHSSSHNFRSHGFHRDKIVEALIEEEKKRQHYQIELIASENNVSHDVCLAQGSVLTNKYAEGYPGARYYGGCEVVDKVEELALDRVKSLFGSAYANVQPHSGSQANQAVFTALLSPGDKILSMDLNAGGHLTHGAKVNLSGKWFEIESYGVDPGTGWLDMNEVEEKARACRPKLIIAGGSSYPRALDFKRFREIADDVDAYLMVDMAHFSGLVAGGHFPSPIPYAHVVTSTTHKTLRGPRGGLILTQDDTLSKKINSAVFPGIQGGPLMHVIAGKAVAFGEALTDSFALYTKKIMENAKSLGAVFQKRGYKLVTDGTDCHYFVLDLRPQGITGADAEKHLDSCGFTVNKNSLPFDTVSPRITSGIRVGTPVVTTRHMGPPEMELIGHSMATLLDALSKKTSDLDRIQKEIRAEMNKLCDAFPLPLINVV